MKDPVPTHYEALLLSHNVRPTAGRLIVARALDEAGRPLSMSELEARIGTIDKSNIFRSLTLFHAHHLVHAIEDGSESVRYELCLSHSDTADDDTHVHFYCERCGRTFCLDHVAIPPVDYPAGYVVNTVNYLAKGLCPQCARRTACAATP